MAPEESLKTVNAENKVRFYSSDINCSTGCPHASCYNSNCPYSNMRDGIMKAMQIKRDETRLHPNTNESIDKPINRKMRRTSKHEQRRKNSKNNQWYKLTRPM